MRGLPPPAEKEEETRKRVTSRRGSMEAGYLQFRGRRSRRSDTDDSDDSKSHGLRTGAPSSVSSGREWPKNRLIVHS